MRMRGSWVRTVAKLLIWAFVMTAMPLPWAAPAQACMEYGNPEKNKKLGGKPETDEEDPVNMASGSFTYQTTDLVLPGRGLDIVVTRTHNSEDPHINGGTKGFEWMMTRELAYWTLTDEVDVGRDTGETVRATFQLSTGGYDPVEAPAIDPAEEIVYDDVDDVYVRTLKNGIQETYVFFETKTDFSGSTYNRYGLGTIRDRNGNEIDFVYQGTVLDKIVDPAGRELNVTWNGGQGFNDLTSLTDWTGREWTYEYDGSHRLTKFTDPEGLTEEYSFDSENRMTEIVDGRGSTHIEVEYDENNGNKVTTQRRSFEGGTHTWEFEYYDSPPRTEVESFYGMTSLGVRKFYHDGGNRITKKVDPLGNEREFLYDADWNLTKYIDERNFEWTYGYDGKSNMTSGQNPLGHTTTWAYDLSIDKPTSMTSPLNQVWEFSYDSNANLTSVEDPLGHVTDLTVNGFGLVTSLSPPSGHDLDFGYDGNGYLTSLTDNLNHAWSYAVDPVGRVTAADDPLSHGSTLGFDRADRLTTVTDELGNDWSFTFDGNHNLSTTTDPLGNQTTYSHTTLETLSAVTNAAGGVTDYGYLSTAGLDDVDDARGVDLLDYTYDLAGRLTSTNYAGRTTTLTLDAAGNLTRRATPNGVNLDFEYDARGLLTKRVLPGTDVTYSYDAAGRRTQMTDPEGTVTCEYDLANRLTEVDHYGEKSVLLAYDTSGKLTKLTDANAEDTTYTYDSADRVTKVSRLGNDVTFTLNDAGLPTQRSLPNGLDIDYAYDGVNQVTAIDFMDGATPVASLDYAYDGAGNRTSVTVTNGMGTDDYDFEYDKLHQLTKVKLDGDTLRTYAYDAVGNRTSMVEGSTTSYTYNDRNEMTAAGSDDLEYDANGNLTEWTSGANVTTYEYDATDQLTKVIYPDSDTSEYRYDGDGLRIWRKEKDGTKVREVRTPSGWVLNELDDLWTTDVSAFILGPSGPLGIEDLAGDELYYYLQDALGSVRTVTGDAGDVLGTYRYDEFGVLEASTGSAYNPVRYASYTYDADLGSYYLRSRWYGAEWGRFYTRDRWPGSLAQPVTLNSYAYAQNNPVNQVDHWGFRGRDDRPTAAEIGTAIGQTIFGIGMMVVGAGMVAGGGTLTVATAGAGSPVTIPASAVGGVAMTVGAASTASGLATLSAAAGGPPIPSFSPRGGGGGSGGPRASGRTCPETGEDFITIDGKEYLIDEHFIARMNQRGGGYDLSTLVDMINEGSLGARAGSGSRTIQTLTSGNQQYRFVFEGSRLFGFVRL